MKVQAITLNTKKNVSLNGYRNLSKDILNPDRKVLINIAEYFHNAPETELKQITNSDPVALKILKEAIDGVIIRKKCYLADGAPFAKERAVELDKKAASRNIFLEA